ncbi:hypothetical protein AYO38_04445 [bacterium SCGC AG-212-C10]|nr:hypothetical protein AYO38_04445 [bacterium SCGC AG-212-C10]
MSTASTPVLPRIQLALNVPDLDAAIAFYNGVFQAEPAKVRAGYANYALTDPPLKLVLIENPDANERLNHLGVEVATSEDVVAHTRRLGETMPIRLEEGTECCYALQDKVWVSGPDRTEWEFYTVLADAPAMNCATPGDAGATVCCAATPGATDKASCC